MRRLFLMLALALPVPAAAAVPTPVSKLTPPLGVTSPAAPNAKPVPLGDLRAVRNAPGALWSPDGKSVVMATNLTGSNNLWRVDLGGTFPLQLTYSDNIQLLIGARKDGRVLFSEDDEGNELWDIFSVPIAGGPATNITNSPEWAETDAKLSPDGKTLAVSRRARTGTTADLVLIDLATGTTRQLTQEKDPSRLWQAAGWSADGRTLYADRKMIGDYESSIYKIDLATGELSRLSEERKSLFVDIEDVSPDGRTLAITSNEKTGQRQAGIMDAASGRKKWLKPTPWEQLAQSFSPDGTRLLVRTNADGRSALAIVDLATMAETPLRFDPGVTLPAHRNNSWADANRLLIAHESGSAPVDYWVVEPDSGRAERITQLAVGSLDPASLPRTEIIAYKSFDGTPISALLTIPFNLKRDGTHPAVVFPHGGPDFQTTDLFSRRAAMLASRGYFVIQPNYRGSTGYGSAFGEANKKDLGGGDLKDVLASTRFLIDTGYVHPKKIGIMGVSYGGYLTLSALSRHPDVFAAGISTAGIFNWFTMWENANGGLREGLREILRDPVKHESLYRERSPITHMRNIKAPLLVLHGENDARVPIAQAAEVVKSVKAQGGTVESKFYSDEGHTFTKVQTRHDTRERILAWFDKYLKGEGTGTPAE